MKVTQWGEYGIHCAAFIARRQSEGALSISAHEIASEYNIAVDYAQQILQRLRRAGVIESVRGPHGGYRLARSGEEITLKDILNACEGASFQSLCAVKPIDTERCKESTACGLRDLWEDLEEHLDRFFIEHRLSDLAVRLAPPKGEGLIQLRRIS